MERQFRFRIAHLKALALVVLLLAIAASVSAAPWKFGVMSDTQWTETSDGKNPDGVAVGIVDAINAQCIKQGVKFVIQVGDITQYGDEKGLKTRAAHAEALYAAGIGYYPLRGNHEGKEQSSAQTFQVLFPQTRNKGKHVFGASKFSSPCTALDGLSYSFDYNNVRFILLDQFTRADGSNTPGGLDDNILDQVDWIAKQLPGRPANGHAFVFAHKLLIDQNHVDCLFGKNPAGNQDGQNEFMTALAANGVRYLTGGHDHMHHRAIIKSPDGRSQVTEMICASDSYKFYVPKRPSNDETFDGAGHLRETPVSQELGTIGYYIFTVDGPRVTVDYYASDNGQPGNGMGAGQRVDMVAMPSLSFTRHETFGYSLNGKEFTVAHGESYTKIKDSFHTTSTQILSGTNGSKAVDFSSRPLTKAVDTGWTAATARTSDILTLWGMADLGRDQTDTFVLSMTDSKQKLPAGDKMAGLGLATRGPDGKWVNAVDTNVGGSKKFVSGPWKSDYGLGTYGVDPSTNTAWAVVDHSGDFAITELR